MRCQKCLKLFWPNRRHKCDQNPTPRVPSAHLRNQTTSKRIYSNESHNTPPEYQGIHKEATNDLISKNWSAIRTWKYLHPNSVTYNAGITNNEIHRALASENVKNIFHEQANKFKINASLGFILINNSTNALRYWHSSENNSKLLHQTELIEDEEDFEGFLVRLSDSNFLETAMLLRPDTSWCVHLLTNITFYVWPISSHPIGAASNLPDYVLHNRAIVSNEKNKKGVPYNDNLCLFRGIARMREKDSLSSFDSSVQEYFEYYCKQQSIDITLFSGIPIDQLYKVESVFNISIFVYTYDSSDGTQAKLLYQSPMKHKEKLNLHLEGNHYCWIKNLRQYTKSYKCAYCSHLTKSGYALHLHTLSCSPGTKFVYPYGNFTVGESIFDKLRELGIEVDSSRSHYPYYAVFDCETYSDKEDMPRNTATIEWESRHRLASVSICSNIAGYTNPVCFVNENDNESETAGKMMDYLSELSDICYQRLKHRYRDIFTKIEKHRILAIEKEKSTGNQKYIDMLDAKFDRIEEGLHSYLKDLMCFSYNGGRYDIPLLKKHIIHYILQSDEDELKYVIRKANNYMCIQTEKLRFCDICHFLAPNFSYSDYLRAMDVDVKKFFWVHDKFTTLELLKQTSFPEKADFYSSLKREHISDDDYEYCQRVWNEEGMTSLKDLLIYYNNHDVIGFVQAIERQNEFFKSRRLDLKSSVSIPGLAIQYLIQQKDDSPIFLLGEQFKDVYHLIRQNIRGGLSMVYDRYTHVNETRIKPQLFREEARLVQCCVGYDISGFYVSHLMRPMPTGAFIRRQKSNGYRIEKSIKHEKASKWICWLEKQHDIPIHHIFKGVEKRIGGRNLPVDGYAETADEKIIFQFSGCWYHSHMCKYAMVGKYNDLVKDLRNQLETYEKLDYFLTLGYTVIHSWECEFEEAKKSNPQLRKFCSSLRLLPDSRLQVTETTLLREIEQGKIFGMAEVDIRTPEDLKDIFSEFQPIVKHCNVSKDDIGSHMKGYAEQNNLMKRPTRTLLCSYFGDKILLATPLLKWYMEHGLEVTQLHQVIQYHPKACFKHFGEEVMEARREGDVDPSKKIIADSCKLLGNSAYGRTLVNKENHKDLHFYNTTQTDISSVINNKRFQHLQDMEGDMVEVEMQKKQLKLDIPIQIGFFVLEYAKMVLLSFYFDFLLHFLPFDSFSLIQCDTDSMYLSLAGKNIFQTVPVEKQKAFKDSYELWFAVDYCPDHRAEFFDAMLANLTWNPKECCLKKAKYDSRTVGKFHMEWEGDGVIALCSKAYYCIGKKSKYSSKGVSKTHNNLTEREYRNVVFSQNASKVNFKGFRVKGDHIFTYSQTKKGLSYLYGKRIVGNDGVTTFPTEL